MFNNLMLTTWRIKLRQHPHIYQTDNKKNNINDSPTVHGCCIVPLKRRGPHMAV